MKIYIITFLIIIGTYSKAQWYSFEESIGGYNKLDNNSIEGIYTEKYSKNDSISIPFGFKFKYFDQEYDSLIIFKHYYLSPISYFLGRNRLEDYSYNRISIEPYAQNIIYDKGTGWYYYLSTFKPLNYKYNTIGTTGNRVFILEWNNIEFLMSDLCDRSNPSDCRIDSTDFYFCNYQIWFYENSGNIEVHYGNSKFPSYIELDMSINKTYFMGVYLKGIINNIDVNYGEADPNSTLLGWPDEGTIFKFYPDKSNQIFLNDYSFSITNWEVEKDYGAYTGHNSLRDYKWAQKYYVATPINIKGIVSQNYGSAYSDDSATFGIYSVGPDGLPDKNLYETKRSNLCLKLDGSLNYIAFDSIIACKDSFFVSFGFEPYTLPLTDTIGICYSLHTSGKRGHGINAVKAFNDRWYDTQLIEYFGFIEDEDFIEYWNFDIAPVINFNLEDLKTISDSILCKPLSTKIYSSNEQTLYFEDNLIISPIPATTFIDLEFTISEKSDVLILIYNNQGVLKYNSKYTALFEGMHQEKINLSDFARGVYIVKLITNYNSLNSRFILY